MADIGIVAWNIEEFGAFTKLKKGPDSDSWINGTLAAIAQIVNGSKASILVIQEFRKDGKNYLPTLKTYLESGGGSWSFDYLPAAVATGKALDDVKGLGDLDYTGRANSEGYAVLWKGEVLAAFTDLKISVGKNGVATDGNYISLVLTGSSPVFDGNKTPVIGPDGKGYANPARFPTPDCPAVVTSTSEPFKNEIILQFATVRRPCVIKVKSPQYTTPVPVVVYHAPADNPSCLYGALACGLTSQVGTNKTSNVILAGDFNLTTESQFDTISDVYHDLALNTGTRNSTSTGEFGYARTQTQFQKLFIRPAQLVSADKTYEHPRDILFYRDTIRNPMSGVIDVVAQLMTDRSLSKAIFADTDIKKAVLGAIASTNSEYQLPDVVRNSSTLVAQVKAPFEGTTTQFANALAATVFYRCFVSDHLPVWFLITDNK